MPSGQRDDDEDSSDDAAFGRPERRETTTEAEEAGRERASDPGVVFELLRDDIRRDVVLALARLSTEQWDRGTVAYADLRDAVGVEDGGKFNYHLGELRETLVEQTDDGYGLTLLGQRVAFAMLSGRLDGGDRVAAETHSCPHCGDRVTTACDDGYVTMTCPEHGVLFDMLLPPAAATAHDPEAIAALASRRAGWFAELAMQGCCEYCWGSVEARAPIEMASLPVPAEDGLLVEFACERCETTFWLTPGACVLRHPAVVAFCHEHGEDVTDEPMPRVAFAAPSYPHVERTDDGLAITLVREDEALKLWLDGSETVERTERLPADER